MGGRATSFTQVFGLIYGSHLSYLNHEIVKHQKKNVKQEPMIEIQSSKKGRWIAISIK
jgi:hypothetical protein